MALSDFLGANVIKGVFDELEDIRQLPQDLLFTGKRVPVVDATDQEIMARIKGYVIAADLIADDARAVVRSAPPVRLTQSKLPNLKLGRHMSQEMLSLLDRLEQGGGLPGDLRTIRSYIANTFMRIREGVYARMESLVVAMLTDALTYSRLDIQLSGVTWGMPSDLKVTTGTSWATAGSATPIADMAAIITLGREKYGVTYDRVTMSTTTFGQMVATTEFQAKSAGYWRFTFPASGFPSPNDRKTLAMIAGGILGDVTVELYDAQMALEANDGTISYVRYLPVDNVLFTSSALDNSGVMDFANATVIESIVADAVSGVVGGFNGPTRGPVGYTSADHNPPTLTLWGVARGFPRKHRESASAVLDVIP